MELAEKALENADEFEMRLWDVDSEGIKSGQRFGERVPNNITREIVFKGKVVPELKKEILTDYLTEEGHIKWFTLVSKNNGKHIFTSSHYGDETYILASSEEQVNAIRKWAENYPIIWRVDVFESNATYHD